MELKNYRHELFARALVANKMNQTLSYIEVYKNCSKKSARSKASRLMVTDGNIKHRIAEISLENDLETSLPRLVIKSLCQAVHAKKIIKTRNGVVEMPNYQVQLKAIRMFFKLWGFIK